MPGADDRLTAAHIRRSVTRLFHRADMTVLSEVTLPGGRRADVLAIDGRGIITIGEIKVSRADFLGDRKWPDYCDWCDQFYWVLAAGLDPGPLDGADYRPGISGLIVADAYDAAIVRPAARVPLAPARRKAEMQRLARLAMRRCMFADDPDLAGDWGPG